MQVIKSMECAGDIRWWGPKKEAEYETKQDGTGRGAHELGERRQDAHCSHRLLSEFIFVLPMARVVPRASMALPSAVGRPSGSCCTAACTSLCACTTLASRATRSEISRRDGRSAAADCGCTAGALAMRRAAAAGDARAALAAAGTGESGDVGDAAAPAAELAKTGRGIVVLRKCGAEVALSAGVGRSALGAAMAVGG